MDRDTFEKKRTLFANEDFAKTVQEIISSPRKGKHYESGNIGIYDITENQKAYYTRCFLHCMKPNSSLEGALLGTDEKVLNFFRKSGLDDDELSKIWALSDVNEDGWLDLAEFCTAMHLIVLRVKGELPVPAVLPPSLKPPITTPRTHSQLSSESSRPSCESNATSKLQQSVSEAAEQPGGLVLFSRSEEQLPSKEPAQLKQFSDVPPLLVDGRPTAIKAKRIPEALMLLRSPQGPPPVPPLRNPRGHTRSASLDLKQLNLAPPNLVAESLSSRHMSVPSTTMTAPPLPSRSSESDKAVGTQTTPRSAVASSSDAFGMPVFDAPSQAVDSTTQTDEKYPDQRMLDSFLSQFGDQLQELISLEKLAETGDVNAVTDWNRRVQGLRTQNAELEKERALLAQVRVQLELRLQEHGLH